MSYNHKLINDKLPHTFINQWHKHLNPYTQNFGKHVLLNYSRCALKIHRLKTELLVFTGMSATIKLAPLSIGYKVFKN